MTAILESLSSNFTSNMDFYSICVGFTKLKMSPVFECVHFTLMCISVKGDINKTVSFPFARQHPFASWFASMLMCFASQIWFCFLFSKPLAVVLTNPEKIAIASLIWYFINFMPGDFVYGLLSFKPCMTILIMLKEVQRVYGIFGGVLDAVKAYPGHYLVHFIAGVIKGSSYVWMKPFERFVRGMWLPSNNEFLQPSLVFKASAVISLLFVLESAAILKVDHAILFTSMIMTLTYLRLSTVILGVRDPFVPFENLVCSVLFGGMWDALKRATSQEQLNNNTSAGDNKLKKS